MRMARVNITIPDELMAGARTAGLNVSRLAASALADELDRRAKIAALDNYLHVLEVELGPISAVDAVVAAVAGARPGGLILTSDPDDLRALGEHTSYPITVRAV